MSFAVWPVFEDHREHSLCDEGVPLFRDYEALNAIAVAAGRKSLEAFDKHADVSPSVIAQRFEEEQDIPDLSDLPIAWHDPAEAVATLDAILSAFDSPEMAGMDWSEYPEDLVECLEAFRQTLQQASIRKTRFYFTFE
jgi:hypothetical protein